MGVLSWTPHIDMYMGAHPLAPPRRSGDISKFGKYAAPYLILRPPPYLGIFAKFDMESTIV